MMTPRQRYLTDPQFASLVQMLENYIHWAQFTPTELRDAVVLAAIRYEQSKPLEVRMPLPEAVDGWLNGIRQKEGARG